MRSLLIKLTCPDELDPEDILQTLMEDFYYGNRGTDDIGPHMENITLSIVNEGQTS